MDDAELMARELASQKATFRALAVGSAGGEVLERDGLLACLSPGTPDTSIPNGVFYGDAEALLAAREELEDRYARAGVRAWTVWVRPGDREVARALEAAGHALDGTPALMAARIEEMDLEPRGALDLVADARWEEVGRVNDVAYGAPHFERLLQGARPPGLVAYAARAGGHVAAVACVVHEDGDCGVSLVATVPEARGRGLCSELLRLALREAHAAGCVTTSLEATALGQPVYERLGYRVLGRIEMWEHRVPAPAV